MRHCTRLSSNNIYNLYMIRLEKGWDYMRKNIKHAKKESGNSSRFDGVIQHISKYQAEMGNPLFVSDPFHYKSDWDKIFSMRSSDNEYHLFGDYRVAVFYDESGNKINGHPFLSQKQSFTAYLPTASLLNGIVNAYNESLNIGAHSAGNQKDPDREDSSWWLDSKKRVFVVSSIYMYLKGTSLRDSKTFC